MTLRRCCFAGMAFVLSMWCAHTALVTATVQWLPPPAPTRVRGIDETRARRVRWLLEPLVDGSRIRG
jgi:hypothetical protein